MARGKGAEGAFVVSSLWAENPSVKMSGAQQQPARQKPKKPQAGDVPAERLLVEAVRLQQTGDAKRAEILLKDVLRKQPNNAQAYHLLGAMADASGDRKRGIALIEKAIALNGNLPLFHVNITEMLRKEGLLDRALAHGKKAVALAPKLAKAHSNLGIVYFDMKALDEAEACQKKALSLSPDLRPALNNLAGIMRRRGNFETAIQYYRKALKTDPYNVRTNNNLAVTLTQSDRPQEALLLLDKILAKNPEHSDVLCNKAAALMALGENGKALVCFNEALQIDGDCPEAHLGIAKIYKEQHMLEDAEREVLEAISQRSGMVDAYCTLGSIRVCRGRSDIAVADFETALSIDPTCENARLGLGNIYIERGEIDNGIELFDDVLSRNPNNMNALFSMVHARKVEKSDKVIDAVNKAAKRLDKISDSRAVYINYAVGKMLDDLGEHDRAFKHYIEGASLKRKTLNYNPDLRDRHFQRVKDVFSEDFIKQHDKCGVNDSTPIFIVGMPRSGTTLTEQIISSHPDVFGAGELHDLLDVAGHFSSMERKVTFPANMKKRERNDFKDMGREYVRRIKARAPKTAHRITDKMPINFINVGLINLILPKAKIVHIQRNPLDTCISCFTRLFQFGQEQTYDLEELGHFYRGYVGMMDHWRKVLPAGSFYELRYEDLVENTEEQARTLLDYCGLAWDDSCLEFYNNKRSVRTASVTQVRKPIYKTSMERWRKYEKHLGPLIAGLGDVLDKK